MQWVNQHWGECSGIAIKMFLCSHTESRGFFCLYLTLEDLGQVWFDSFGILRYPQQVQPEPWGHFMAGAPSLAKNLGTGTGVASNLSLGCKPASARGGSGWDTRKDSFIGRMLSPHHWKRPKPSSRGSWDSKVGLSDLRSLFQPQ